ncbi:MAG: TIGR04255 family protein [Sediminibacterium sp.]|nr:TIGR04255 family protein [Sediminibacterium sp.]
MNAAYINFFENNIFDHIKLKLFIDNNEHYSKNTIIRTELEKGEYKTTFQIVNNVSRVVNNQQVTGSLIDIDTAKESNLDAFFNNMQSIINNGHLVEKEIFFNLLTDEFIKSYKPIY